MHATGENFLCVEEKQEGGASNRTSQRGRWSLGLHFFTMKDIPVGGIDRQEDYSEKRYPQNDHAQHGKQKGQKAVVAEEEQTQGVQGPAQKNINKNEEHTGRGIDTEGPQINSYGRKAQPETGEGRLVINACKAGGKVKAHQQRSGEHQNQQENGEKKGDILGEAAEGLDQGGVYSRSKRFSQKQHYRKTLGGQGQQRRKADSQKPGKPAAEAVKEMTETKLVAHLLTLSA